MLNGHDDDDPMASGALSPVAPLSNSEDSDNTMHIDSDLDTSRNPDVDADGEYDDDDDAEPVPQPSGATSSYHSKRAVRRLRFPPVWFRVLTIGRIWQVKDEDESVRASDSCLARPCAPRS